MKITPQPHHVRGVECDSRPLYRRGRRARAVKAFTIADESTHLLVFGVPAVNLLDEVIKAALKYGQATVNKVNDYPGLEEFTELFHIHFTKLAEARSARRKMDGLEFFGGILHVCYAPELETLEETRSKLIQRSKMVQSKVPQKKAKTLRSFDDI